MALSGTLYDSAALTKASSSSSSSNYSNTNALRHDDPSLLRALSERLLDPDIPCAVIAAGCLSNHVSFGAMDNDHSAAGGDNAESSLEVSSQVILPILLQRIRTSWETCRELSGRLVSNVKNNSSNVNAMSHTKGPKSKPTNPSQIDKLHASLHEQWNLQSLSLQTLAGLIENCPLAVQRMSAESTLPLLFGVLYCALEYIDSDCNLLVDKLIRTDHPVYDAASNTARALHSLLDENVELIMNKIPNDIGRGSSSINSGGGETIPDVNSIVKELTRAITNEKITNTARLHACGAVLSLRKAFVEEHDAANTNHAQICQTLQSCACNLVVPALHAVFSFDANCTDNSTNITVGTKSSPQSMVQRMISLYKTLQNQRRDEAMESEITNEINARKEPARMIARRQKEMKAKNKGVVDVNKNNKVGDAMDTMDEDKKEGCTTVMVEDDSNTGNEVKVESESSDPREELEIIMQYWRELCTSQKLALELVTNLCSGPSEGERESEDMTMYDEENEHMWDSDDEAKLLDGMNTSSSQKAVSPIDKEMFDCIASHHLTEQILVFFRNWLLFLPGLALGDGDKCPPFIGEDVEELLSTCALCLGNMMACDIPTWTAPVAGEITSVTCPGANVESGSGLFWWSLVSLLKTRDFSSLIHVTTIMLSLLRHHVSTRTLADAPTLDLLLNLLSCAQTNEGTNNFTWIQMHCNIIAMLGVLCSEPHPDSANVRVCSALMEKMRSASAQSDSIENCKQSVVILNEVYNVIMDIYGGDDANDKVYGQQDVSGHLTRTLPAFKRSIKKISSVEKDMEEWVVWNETALNVSRFIKFKRE